MFPSGGSQWARGGHLQPLLRSHEDLFIVNPYGFAFCELTASRLLICNFDGEVVSGEGVPEDTAFFIHAEIHKRLPRAKVVVHTHMPYATALAITEGDPLIFAGQTALKFYGPTAVDDCYNGLALDRDEGRRIAEAVGDADVVFMKHHGVVVIGETIEAAWDDLYYLKRASEVQCLAQSTGRKVSPIDSGRRCADREAVARSRWSRCPVAFEQHKTRPVWAGASIRQLMPS